MKLTQILSLSLLSLVFSIPLIAIWNIGQRYPEEIKRKRILRIKHFDRLLEQARKDLEKL